MGEIWVCAKKKEAFFCKKKLLIISSSLKQEWMRYSKRRPHNDKPNVVRCVYKISLSPCSKSKWVSIEKCWLFHVSGLQSIWMLHIHWPLSQVFNCFLMRISQQLITWQQVSIFRYVDKVKARLLKFKWVLSIRIEKEDDFNDFQLLFKIYFTISESAGLNVDVRGHRRMARLLLADRKVAVFKYQSMQKSFGWHNICPFR